MRNAAKFKYKQSIDLESSSCKMERKTNAGLPADLQVTIISDIWGMEPRFQNQDFSNMLEQLNIQIRGKKSRKNSNMVMSEPILQGI